MKKPRLTKIFHSEDFVVYLVDGSIVRRDFDISFASTGHFYRYPLFIQENEIWIEKMLDRKDMLFNCGHAIVERFLIKVCRYSCDKAHERASRFEEKIRKNKVRDPIDIALKTVDKVAKRKLTEARLSFKKLIKFPELRQTYSWDCGASAFQSILAFYDVDIDEGTLIEYLGTNDESGTNIKMIEKIAREKFGLKTINRTNLTIEKVKKLIDKNVPVLMLIQAWPWPEEENPDWEKMWTEGHYVVAVGYTSDKMIFEDPSSVVRTYIPFDELDARWHDYDLLPNGKKLILRRWGMIFYGRKQKFDPNDVVKMESLLVPNPSKLF